MRSLYFAAVDQKLLMGAGCFPESGSARGVQPAANSSHRQHSEAPSMVVADITAFD